MARSTDREKEMTYYHGTHSKNDFTSHNPRRGRYDICLTSCHDVAKGYALEHGDGVVYTVETESMLVASREDVFRVLEEAGFDTDITIDCPFFYLLVDDVEVQDIVGEEYDAIEYEDEDWDNVAHDCLRVLKGGFITIINSENC